MDEYKRPYLILFNSVTDALTALEHSDPGDAAEILIKAQQDAEDAYIEMTPFDTGDGSGV